MARSRSAGFTILELLISLTLLGAIGVVMFGGMWYGIQTWHRSTVFAERADDMTVVRRSLTQLLGHTYPLYVVPPPHPGSPAASGGDRAGVAFAGTDRSIQFLAPTPQALGGAGMTRFWLRVEPSKVGVNLVMRAQPELTNNPGNWIVSTILEHAKEIDFSYYNNHVTSDTSPKWLNHWEHQTMLPKLIRISIEFPEFKWPEVTIGPRIAADASCSFDPSTMTCGGR